MTVYTHMLIGRHLHQVIHARSGVPWEIMGLMQGKVVGHSIVIMDSFALPVQGTETRVNAANEANFPVLLAGTLIMAAFVVIINRLLIMVYGDPVTRTQACKFTRAIVILQTHDFDAGNG